MKGASGIAIYIGVLLPFISSQQIPTQLIFPLTSRSVNGSSATGHCTGATKPLDRYQCDDPTSNVVYDGHIPTLTGLDGNMWASQLLIINASSAVLVFDFTGTSNFQVKRVEMVVFNCPQWGISVQSVVLTTSTLAQFGDVNPTPSSCDSLLRICISNRNIGSSQPVFRLEFTTQEPTDWIHIAEVGFYGNSGTCPPEIFIREPTTVTVLPTTLDIEKDDVVSTSLTIGNSMHSDNTTSMTNNIENGDNGSGISTSPGVLAAGVIIALFLVTIAVLIIIIICVKRSHGKPTKFRSSTRHEPMGTIEDIEMANCNHHPRKKAAMSAGSVSNSCDRVQHVSTCEGEGGPMYKDTVAKPTAVTETTYEAVNQIPSQNGIANVHSTTADDKDMYNRLGEIKQRKASSKPQVENGQDLYNRLEKSDVDMYSTVKTPEQPPAIYAVVNKPKQRKPPPQPNPPPADEYATVNKHRSPEVPIMSDDCLTELTQQEAENESLVPYECLGEKPLYCNTENLFPPNGAVCTETGTPLPNESGSIYEQIYEIKTLSPSAFIEESYLEESHEDLYPCSSIYTVPEVIEEEPLELSCKNIQLVKKLGSGNFGDVILAKTVGLSCKDLKMSSSTDTNVQVLVAIKMLKQNANMMDRTLFDKEYKFMSRLNGPNVIRLLGVCKTSTPFIMMEYMENGDLNAYLKAVESIIYSDSPEGNSKENKTITTTTLISLCTQIASAMKYLASKNFVHRDLATRNCLVGSNYQVKIADFGMSRNMYESHYYVIKGHAILPIRWMATECFYGQFSAKTDVWAFGVTMWEIFDLARNEPYYEMEDKDLVKDAIKGKNRKLLPCPKACPEEMYRIMNLCWAHKSSDRETFENLYQALSSL